MGAWSIWHWLVVLVIVMLVFGTKKLRNIGQDLGGALKGFKEGMKDGSAKSRQIQEQFETETETQAGDTFESTAHKE